MTQNSDSSNPQSNQSKHHRLPQAGSGQMSIFRLAVFAVTAGMFFYVAHQLIRFSDFSAIERIFALLVILIPFLAVLSMPFYFWGTDRHSLSPKQKFFIRFAEYSMAYLNFILVFVVARDFLGFTLSLFGKEDPRLYSAQAGFFGLVLPFVLIGLGSLPIIWGPKIIEHKLRIKNLPASLKGLKIAQISDLHISNSSTHSHLKRVFAKTTALNADLLVLTGDIIDGNSDEHMDWIRELGQVKTKYGSYYCSGNHEFYWNIDKCLSALQQTPIKTLMNEASTIQIGDTNLCIAGIADPAARMFGGEGPNWEKLNAFLPEKAFKILLCHQPFLADQACKLGYDLQLSGHTHNGQFFPWNMLIRFFQKYSKGEFTVGSMKLYVNQGTGYWGPAVRLGTSCEVSLLELDVLES